MTLRARILTNGDSQTVELPEDCRFPAEEREVLVHREGEKVILEPVTQSAEGWTPEFLATLGSLKDEEIPLPRQRLITDTKDPFE
jgi:virulence-associated protein VagC